MFFDMFGTNCVNNRAKANQSRCKGKSVNLKPVIHYEACLTGTPEQACLSCMPGF